MRTFADLLNSGDQLFIMGGRAAYDDSYKPFADFGSVLGTNKNDKHCVFYVLNQSCLFLFPVFDVVNYKAMSMATIGDVPPARYS